MANPAGRSARKPGRPPNPKYNLERSTRALSKLLDDAFDSADKAEDAIADELKRPELGPADRLLALSQMVNVVKFRTTMACEVIATFGRKRAEDILAEPEPGGRGNGDGPSASPFKPGALIMPTKGTEEEPP